MKIPHALPHRLTSAPPHISHHTLLPLSSTPPGILFLPGFQSTFTTSLKSHSLRSLALTRTHPFTTLDYTAHGASHGTMPGFTLSKAVADTHRVFQDIAPPCPHVLVGSSMGLWIALHIAKMCPERVVGVVGVGGAVNFVRRMEDRIPGKEWLRMHEESESGRVEHPFCRIPSRYDPNGYIVGWNLLRDANKWVVTPGWDVECPVELIHGLRDEDVPYTESVRTADMLKGRDVRVTLVKDGDHRLSRQEDLEVICEAVERVIGKWKSGGGTNEQS